jgi:hypothetical protein
MCLENFLIECKKVEEFCKKNESGSGTKTLQEIEKLFPDFFKNLNSNYQKCDPEKNLINFQKLLKKISNDSEKKSDTSQKILRNLELDKEGKKDQDLELSFDGENQTEVHPKPVKPSDSPNQTQSIQDVQKELGELKKRNFRLFNRVNMLEQKMSLLTMENNTHIRKTYNLQSELFLRSSGFDSLSLLELHPKIESNIHLKLYFWGMFRRLHFFARNCDLFRKKIIKVNVSKSVRIEIFNLA